MNQRTFSDVALPEKRSVRVSMVTETIEKHEGKAAMESRGKVMVIGEKNEAMEI